MAIVRLVTLPCVTTAFTTPFLPDVITISGVLGNISVVSTIILSTTSPDNIARALLATPSTRTKGGLTYPLPVSYTHLTLPTKRIV